MWIQSGGVARWDKEWCGRWWYSWNERTLGWMTMDSTHRVLGHLLDRLLVRLHCSILTHFLTLHCLLHLRALLISFIWSLAHSLTLQLVGKSFFCPLFKLINFIHFHPIVTRSIAPLMVMISSSRKLIHATASLLGHRGRRLYQQHRGSKQQGRTDATNLGDDNGHDGKTGSADRHTGVTDGQARRTDAQAWRTDRREIKTMT